MLVSGRQPYRTGLYGPTLVLLPGHSGGLPHDEITIAEALRDMSGYKTGIVGKWHLGNALLPGYQCYCIGSSVLFLKRGVYCTSISNFCMPV